MKLIVFIQGCGRGELQVKIEHRRGEEDAVNQVERAPMPGID